MPITKLTAPADPFAATADWTRALDYFTKLYLSWNGPISQINFSGNLVLKGAVFQIGGAIFYADADTAISGTPSDYVQLTPGASTATAAYVANLTGVTWNDTYNGYYDGSSNIYVFDEDKALYNGALSIDKSRFFQKRSDGNLYANNINNTGNIITGGNATITGTIQAGNSPFKFYVDNIGVWDMDATASISVTVSGLYPIQVIILSDTSGGSRTSFPLYRGGYWSYVSLTGAYTLFRDASGAFDSTSYDSGENRGYIWSISLT